MKPPHGDAKRHMIRRLAAAIWPEAGRHDGRAALGFLAGPLCRHCALPVEIDLADDTVCPACIASPPAWNRAAAPLAYDDTTRPLILALKHGGSRDRLKLAGRWMREAGGDMLDSADLLVPVPLHRTRLAARGFNQSLWLAAAVSRASGVPLATHWLKRKRRTPSQAGLNTSARARNVQGAFSVPDRRKSRIRGKRLVLIDDVYTTGATLTACTRELKRAGAANVDILVLARVVRPETLPI
jgi:ComF family protein